MKSSLSPISDVADTALWVATYRAQENERPQALFRDPLAARLAGSRGRDLAQAMPGSRQFGWTVVVRTRIIDEVILEAAAQGTDTVLNLGAGLDTRPYRLALPPGLRWVEVDQPKLVDVKAEALRGEVPTCALERVAADLSVPAERRRVFDHVDGQAQRTLVLTEGLMGYLPPDEVAGLAADLRARRSFQTWVQDYVSAFLRKKMKKQRGVQRMLRNAPFRFDVPDWEAFLLENGWRVTHKRPYVEEGERLGRPIPLPRLYRWAWRFTSQSFRVQVRQMAGIAVLAPDAATSGRMPSPFS